MICVGHLYSCYFFAQVGDSEGRYDPEYHGTTGPIKITLANWVRDSATYLMQSAGNFAGFEFNQDPNSGNMLGLSWAQINQGVRSNPPPPVTPGPMEITDLESCLAPFW